MKHAEKIRDAGQSSDAIPVAYVVHTQQELRAALVAPPASHTERIGVLLVMAGRVSDADIQRALVEQQKYPKSRLGEILLSEGCINEDELYSALSLKLGVAYVRLGKFDLDTDVLTAIPQEVARSYGVLPLMRHHGHLVIAMTDTTSSDVLGALSVLTRATIEPVLASPGDLEVAMATHYPRVEDESRSQVSESRVSDPRSGSIVTTVSEASRKLAHERPTVRLVANLLHDAIQRRASDIHIRPREHDIEVLYRIDGSLVPIQKISAALLPGVVARLKVLGSMDLGEHRVPQDGAFHLSASERQVDLRVSIMPSLHGENVVIHVLDQKASLRRIADVGLEPADERRFRRMIGRNQGIVLVTGPAGSGKTTTLYAALQELNTGEYHIVTVEDPIEYRLEGIVQTQAHAEIEYGFSTALRHVLRHDPDIILLGEIRDQETARVAIESALTGHLVFSTLHTNSATQTITRLLEMGIEPYLVSTTLAGTLAQRLARRNCRHCLQPEIVDENVRAVLGVSSSETFYKGAGCEKCGGLGHDGRIALYELLPMTPAIQAATRACVDGDQLQSIAIREGMIPLVQQALTLARTGAISLLEVFRSRLE